MSGPQHHVWPEPFYRVWLGEEARTAIYRTVVQNVRDSLDARVAAADLGERDIAFALAPEMVFPEFLYSEDSPELELATNLMAAVEAGGALTGVCSKTRCATSVESAVVLLHLSRPYRARGSRVSVVVVTMAGSWDVRLTDSTQEGVARSALLVDWGESKRFDLQRVDGHWRVVAIRDLWVT